MTKFNFIRDDRVTWLERMRDAPLDGPTRQALGGLILILAIATAVGVGERTRVTAAVLAADMDAAKVLKNEARVRDLRADIDTVRELASTAAAIHRIRISGTVRATEFAQIGNLLPPRAWLASIRRDEDGLTLEGGAADYSTLGSAMRALSHVPLLGQPRLVRARAETGLASGVLYELRLREHRR